MNLEIPFATVISINQPHVDVVAAAVLKEKVKGAVGARIVHLKIKAGGGRGGDCKAALTECTTARASAELVFDDAQVALQALTGGLDHFAAINGGAIRVGGLAPLAEKVGLVMDRVSGYLDT